MQVATLFRESTTLLGETMETGGGPSSDSSLNGASSQQSQQQQQQLLNNYETFNHPSSSIVNNYQHKYKLKLEDIQGLPSRNMKLEANDDGYETSADLLMNNTANNLNHNNHDVKREKTAGLEDPYSFIDDDPIPMLPSVHHHHHQGPPHLIHHPMPQLSNSSNQLMMPGPKKRGRKKKIKPEMGMDFSQELNGVVGDGVVPHRPLKERKKHDRFNGMPEDEVSKRTLPDHLTENLDIIIIGINPGLFAAYKGHHYAGPGNHFWKCLYLSGLTPQQMSADEDYKLVQVGIGFTNMVQRATKGSADLTRKEIKEGSQILLDKLRKFRPKVAVFNGKLIYEVFSGKKDFKFGRQPDLIDGTSTHMWVMPSSSARCAQLPRAADKVPFYAALKKFRDYLNGIIPEIDENEMVFSEPKVKSCYEAEPKSDLYSSELTDISSSGVGSGGGVMVIKNEDGTIIPCKKKRGRPKKIKIDGEESSPSSKASIVRKPPPPSSSSSLIIPPTTSSSSATTNINNTCGGGGGGDFPKKKRGRPKKVKLDNVVDGVGGSLLPLSAASNNISQQQQQQQQCFSTNNSSPNNFYPINMVPASMTPPLSSSLNNNTNNTGVGNNLYNSQSLYNNNNNHQSPRSYNSQQQQQQSPARQQYNQSPRPHYNNSPRPPSYSPRPHSQPFTHSDLSSEISAAISSEQLGSPSSPSPLGPPDFDPPTATTTTTSSSLVGDVDNNIECRLSPSLVVVNHQSSSNNSNENNIPHHHHYHMSPAAVSTNGGDQQHHYHYQPYNMEPSSSSSSSNNNNNNNNNLSENQYSTNSQQQQQQQQQTQQQQQQQKPQDLASKSLSGLESLVDQIPSITDSGDTGGGGGGGGGCTSLNGDSNTSNNPDQYSTNQYNNNVPSSSSSSSVRGGASPVSYNYPPSSAYPLYPTPTWSGTPYEPMPLSYSHHQIPYPHHHPHHHHHHHHPHQSYTPGLHVPNPNYPYYSYPQPTPPTHHPPPGYPPYLGGF